MKRKTLAIFLIVVVTIVGYFLFRRWLLTIDWRHSPDELVISEERPFMEVDYNYIPEFQVWGDGHVVWTEFAPNGERKVLEGYITEPQLKQILQDFMAIPRNPKDYAVPHIRVNLVNSSTMEWIDPQNDKLMQLVEFLKSGAGAIPSKYEPSVGRLLAIPVMETSYRNQSDIQVKYIWPDDEFGYQLSTVYAQDEKEITGVELDLAWEIVNSSTQFVMSNGEIYWIAIIVDKISPF